MRFRNAIHITIDNFSSVFKLLLYSVLTGAVFMSLSYLIIRLGLDGIFSGSPTKEVAGLIKGFFNAIVTGDSNFLNAFHDTFAVAFNDFKELLLNSTGAIVGTFFGVAAIYLLSRFMNGLGRFAVAGTMNDRMGTFSRTKFSSSYFKNIAKGALYEVIYVPLIFLYDVIMVLVCWFAFFEVPALLSISGWVSVFFSLAFTTTAVACLEALKMTLISAWIPGILADEKGVSLAFRDSLRAKKHFGRRFASFLVAVYLIIVTNVLFALCTFGSALLVTLPLSFVFLLALQFVQYYEDNSKKYFISSRTITGGEEKPNGLDE
ncbi:MAG: hypothetical protein K2L02_02590 [Clostridia bacterium]|nr:hypothetical protein [Clostridia bacterium]